MRIAAPCPEEVFSSREMQRLRHWGSAAEFVLRDLGILPLKDADSEAVTFMPAPAVIPGGGSAIAEVPIAVEGHAHFPLRWAKQVQVDFGTGHPPIRLGWPKLKTRTGESADVEAPPSWWPTVDDIPVLEAGSPSWEPAGRVTVDGDELPLLYTLGDRLLVLSVPLVQLLAGWTAVQPLNHRYAGYASVVPRTDVLQQELCTLLTQFLRRSGLPFMTIDPHPPSFSSAFSVRHDYDRVMAGATVERLLELYARKSIRAGLGVQVPNPLPEEPVFAFVTAGHELQLHSPAASSELFSEGVATLARKFNAPVYGSTIHGGPSGVGYLGQLHTTWAEEAGQTYTEMLTAPRRHAFRPLVVTEDRVIRPARLMATPRHLSFDRSTRVGEHEGIRLADEVPVLLAAGNYVVVMNHPDIHTDAWVDFIEALDLDNVWTAGPATICQWVQAARFRTFATKTGKSVLVRTESALPAPATLRHVSGDAESVLTISGTESAWEWCP